MRFSILIPVYNVEKYLPRCMETVMAQTFTDFEVLLVNDGSTDGSGAICDRYAKEYPDKVRVFHKENEGLLLTRRYSLKRAQGEYMIFVDSDDYVSEGLLASVNDAIEKYGADMVLYNFYRFVEGEEGLSSPDVPFADGTVFEGDGKSELYKTMLLGHFFVNLWVKAVKRDIIDIDADYSDRAINKGEDVLQTLPIFTEAKKVVYIDKKLYYYRKNTGSMTVNVKKTDCTENLTLQDGILEYLDIWGSSDNMRYSFISNQMVAFYHWLRRMKAKSKALGDASVFKEALACLGEDHRFLDALSAYRVEYSAKRLRFRMRLFKMYMLNKRWRSATLLIGVSNLFGGGA